MFSLSKERSKAVLKVYSNPSIMCIVEGTFFFDPADMIYQFHFPGHPVVPGSVVIHAFMKAVKERGWADDIGEVENFRFKTFVTPGEYSYSLEQKGGTLNCRLFKNKKAIVTGRLRI